MFRNGVRRAQRTWPLWRLFAVLGMVPGLWLALLASPPEPASASVPTPTGPLTLTAAANEFDSIVTTDSASPQLVSLPFTVTNHYGDLDLTAAVTLTGSATGRIGIDATGLTLTTTSAGSTVTVSGSATDVATALASRLKWEVPTTAGDTTATVRLEQALPSGTAYFPGNGHLYRTLMGSYDWYQASNSAAATSLWGRTGYLVTITSEAEQQVIDDLTDTADYWIAASDGVNQGTQEGTWIWTAGPEQGDVFWDRDTAARAQRGTVTVGAETRFAWWTDGEPNDLFAEDGAIFDGNEPVRGWADRDRDATRINAIAEYGWGPNEDAPHIATSTVTLTATPVPAPPAPPAPPPPPAAAPAAPPDTTPADTTPDTTAPETTVPDTTEPETTVAEQPATEAPTDAESSADDTTVTAEPADTPAETPADSAADTPTDTTAVPAPVEFTVAPTANGSPSTSPMVTRPDGSALAHNPMTGSAYVDGQPVGVDVRTVGPGQVEVSGAGVNLRFSAIGPDGAPIDGDQLTLPHGGLLTVTGSGFGPGSRVDVWAFSTPVFLGSAGTSAGSVDVEVVVPDVLPAGSHTIQLTGVSPDGLPKVVSLGALVIEPAEAAVDATESAAPAPADTAVPTPTETAAVEPRPANAPPFETVSALDDPVGLVDTATTGVAVLAAAGASAAAAARAGGGGAANRSRSDSSSRGGERTEERAELRSVDVVGVAVELEGAAAGDSSRIWRWPGTGAIDRWSAGLTVALGPRLPLVSRLVADGAPARAMFGSVTALLPAAGVMLGIWAAVDTAGVAMPPAFWLMTTIILLGVLDAFAGALAFFVFALGVTVQGGIIDVDSIRALMGIGVMCFAPGLIAAAFRPVRRAPASSGDEWWERIVDFAVVPLMAGMTVQAMVWALNGVAGVDFPFGYEANRVALLVIAVMFVKVLMEETAARWFPARLLVVSPPSVPEPSTLRSTVTVVIKTSVYVFVVLAILGNVWQLWVAAAMFAVPQLLMLWTDRLPNIPLIWYLAPLGVPSMIMYFLVGTYSGLWVESWLGATADYARTSFVMLTAPFTLVGAMYLIGRQPSDPERPRWCYTPRWRWVYRIGGVGVLYFAVAYHMGWVSWV